MNSIEVYPNPFTQRLNLNMVLKEKQIVEIRMFNAIGIQVSSVFRLEMEKGYQQIDIFKQLKLTSILDKGIYVIKVRINGTEEVVKIVKQ